MNRIIFNSKILGGKLIIKGTRISVDFILELLAGGMSEKEILSEYPRLTKADIKAALEYAVQSINKEVVLVR